MSWLVELALHLVRTLHLLALALAPRWLSPEPLRPADLPLRALLAAAAIAALLALSAWFARRLDSRLAKAGAALVWVAVATALAAAWVHGGRNAPLALGVPLVALPVWAALATLAAAAAEEWLGSNFKHKRMGSTVVVLGIGVTQLIRASGYLGSRERMWYSALRRDAGHERAVHEIAKPLLQKRDHEELAKLTAYCLKVHAPPAQGPARGATCACLELRADLKVRARDAEALRHAEALRVSCPGRAGARATLAEALVLAGQLDAAVEEAWTALEEGGDPARIHHALALAYQGGGKTAEAKQHAARAIEAGAGRDAQLFAGALAIVTGDLDGAAGWLQPLVKSDPTDDEALYNLALVADQRGDYNGARQGYLAALKANPRNADARYNLAQLTFRAGVLEESRHHARKFSDMFPDDPRGHQLAIRAMAPDPAAGSPAPQGGQAPPPAATAP